MHLKMGGGGSFIHCVRLKDSVMRKNSFERDFEGQPT